MDCSTPGFPVHHQIPELAKTHFHQVVQLISIQPSIPLLFLSPPDFNHSQHQSLLQRTDSSLKGPKCWSFNFSISPSSEYSGLISFRIDWFDILSVQGTLKSLLSSTTIQEQQFFRLQPSLRSNSHIHAQLLEKP